MPAVRPTTLRAFLLASLAACGGPPASAPPPASSPSPQADATTIAFTDVTVVPMDRQGVVPGQTVVVTDGVIAQVAPAAEVTIPDGATRVDGSGKYLMPGLAEMHGHYPSPDTAREFTETVLFLYVSSGVTLVRGMLGEASHLPLRDAIARGEVLGPRLVVGSPPMSGSRVESADQARKLVRQYAQAGFDHIKVHEGLAPEVYDAIAQTAKEVGIRFAGHVSDPVGLRRSLAAGQSSIEHLDNYLEELVVDRSLLEDQNTTNATLMASMDESRIADLVEATRQAGAAMAPTMALMATLFGNATSSELQRTTMGLRYMPPKVREEWATAVDDRRAAPRDADANDKLLELRCAVLVALSRAGVPILFSTDSPQLYSVPGFSVHREMEVMAGCGMSRYEVLRSATSAVADYYGADSRFGKVAVGMRADLLLIDGNPLEDLGNVARRSGVMVNGRWLPQSEIQRRLDTIAASY